MTRNAGTPLPHLKAWRKRACLSQNELAIQANLSELCIQSLEVGRYGARPSTMRMIAEALRITPQQLLEEVPA